MSARPRIGLALGCGGARGWALLGVVRALRRAGVAPDVVTGSSIGALVGAVYAAGVFEVFAEEVCGFSALQLASFFAELHLPRAGLFSGKPVVDWLSNERLLGRRRFEDLPMCLGVVATDLFREEAVLLRQGNIVEAVRASISLPGIFDPVLREGRVLIDGGLTDPVPVRAARQLGAEFVIAVDIDTVSAESVPPPRTEVPSLVMTLLQTTRLVENTICSHGMRHEAPEMLIQPAVGQIQTMDFIGGRAAIAAGEQAVEAVLPELKQRLGL